MIWRYLAIESSDEDESRCHVEAADIVLSQVQSRGWPNLAITSRIVTSLHAHK